jgi:hypothetical protein
VTESRRGGIRAFAWACSIATALVCVSTAARADNWTLKLAAWNLFNLGDRKAGLAPVADRTQLLNFYASKIAQHDIIFLQEILEDGPSVAGAIAGLPALANNYNCQHLTEPSGRAGRKERYWLCYLAVRPANSGTLTVNAVVDYQAGGGTTQYQASDISQQNAQNVWMRPPMAVSFTYTPPQGNGAAYTFLLHVIHTKPAYSTGPRPPGTAAGAPKHSSVFHELTSLETNLQVDNNVGVLGDLNAACAYFTPFDEANTFAAGWTWLIERKEKTNTAQLSSCAYDRIIFNDGLNEVHLRHGIDKLGLANNQRLNTRRISDHYLVWAEIGKRPKKHQLTASTVDAVATNKRQRHFAPPSAGGTPLKINSIDVTLPTTATAPLLYVVAHDQSHDFGGGRSIPLIDVRGSPTPVTLRNGSFTQDVIWANPVNGAYRIVLDANGDGIYHKYSGDLANTDDEIDFIVDDRPLHSDILTMDDNGKAREIFSAGGARHVYALARGLTPGATVDVYVVARKLLPAGVDWDTLRSRGDLNLASVSVPVNRTRDPVYPSTMTLADKVRTETVAPDGSLFFSAWAAPYRIFNGQAITAAPTTPTYREEYANDLDADSADTDADRDVCAQAAASTDANFRAVCNVNPGFSDYYGNEFNIVIDVDRNGVFGPGDKLDLHDVAQMKTFFDNSPVLNTTMNGSPAIGEYKEYLNAKLALDPPLNGDNTYDSATQTASLRYLCTTVLTRGQYNSIVKPGASIGFKVLDPETYNSGRQMNSGRYTFVDAVLNQPSVPAQADVCVTSQNLSLNDLIIAERASVRVEADDVELGGDIRMEDDSSFCLAATQFTMTNGTLAIGALTVPEPFYSKGFAVVTGLAAGAGGIASYLACE